LAFFRNLLEKPCGVEWQGQLTIVVDPRGGEHVRGAAHRLSQPAVPRQGAANLVTPLMRTKRDGYISDDRFPQRKPICRNAVKILFILV